MVAGMPLELLGYREVASNAQKIFVTFNLLKVKITYTQTLLKYNDN
jgi:hypothetical protein